MTNLVTFEQKKALRYVGLNFDNICTCGGTHDCVCVYLSDADRLITVSSALQWLRDEKGIPCSVHLEFEENNKGWFYYGEYGIKGDNKVFDTETFDTHPLAESALLTAVLTYLIENK